MSKSDKQVASCLPNLHCVRYLDLLQELGYYELMFLNFYSKKNILWSVNSTYVRYTWLLKYTRGVFWLKHSNTVTRLFCLRNFVILVRINRIVYKMHCWVLQVIRAWRIILHGITACRIFASVFCWQTVAT